MHKWRTCCLCILHIIPRMLFQEVPLGPFYLYIQLNKIKTDLGKEGGVLRKLVETALENLSTKEVFLFRISCASCGLEYGNKPILFTKAGVVPNTPDKQIIYGVLYEQEFRDARQVAIRSAAEHMNYCPICKRLVCNQCFLICDDLDMCRQCAAELQQKGQPVAPRAIETVIWRRAL